jgi:myo-inositol 2-dehydrogenase / D-chiro-inositol 1-dehydrogenase
MRGLGSQRSNRIVGVGLIGCGGIASIVHLPILRSTRGAELVAACDPAPTARHRAERIGRVAVGVDSAWLLERGDVDAVVICAPTAEHAAIAVAAARAGRHFYLEKPIATDHEEALRVVDEAARAGVVAAIGFNRRFHPLHLRAFELLQQEAIGAIREATCTFCEPMPPESMPEWKRRRSTGGGVLLDLASHHVDHLRWLLETEIAEVEATIASELTEHDTARLRLRTSSGVDAMGFFSFRAGRTDRLEFVGERGTLRVDRYGWAVDLVQDTGGRVRRRWLPPAWVVSSWRLRKLLRPEHDPSWRRALAAFVGQIQGKEHPLPTPLDGLRSLEVVLAAEESARTGGPVVVDSSEA